MADFMLIYRGGDPNRAENLPQEENPHGPEVPSQLQGRSARPARSEEGVTLLVSTDERHSEA